MTVLEKFEQLGQQASYHYAADRTSEWRLGTPLEREAIAMFDANPELHAEMREIAKGFLWSLEMRRPSRENAA